MTILTLTTLTTLLTYARHNFCLCHFILTFYSYLYPQIYFIEIWQGI